MSETAPSPGSWPQAGSSTSAASDTPADLEPKNDTRRCFVCLTDEPESELPRNWTTPCKCSLEGHHECLLDWIADLESADKPLLCPQCKSKVRVRDQYDPLVHLGDSLTRTLTDWSPSILFSFFGSGALISSAIYGIEALELIAGPEAAARFIIKDYIPDTFNGYVAEMMTLSALEPPNINFAHFFVLPFIGPALVFNRLNLGGFLNIPTSLFLISRSGYVGQNDRIWPPTAEQALYAYPAIKSTYFHLYSMFFRKLERRWEKLARAPHREDDTPNQNGNGNGNGQALGLHGIQFQAEFNFNLGGGRVEENEINEEDIVGVAPQPVQAAQQGGVNGAANAVDDDDHHGLRMIDFDNASSPVSFVTGALLYPAICFAAGEFLRAILPPKMVMKPLRGPITGLLQERWGRSLVGGSLFVIIKDAFFLYVKYRRAMNRPMRKIQNVRDRDRNVRR